MKRAIAVASFKDAVCGMVVSKRTAAAACLYKGKVYYFCAPVCRDKFLAKPEKYLGKRRRWRRLSHTNTHQHRQQDVIRLLKHR